MNDLQPGGNCNSLLEEEDSKRLFFGAQALAPWPKDYPPARMIPEETRHLTLAFLGRHSFSKFQTILPSIPQPSFTIGPAGIAKELIFLHYQSLWERTLLSPFDEFEHTADIAFLIRGYSIQELHQHAQLALAFQFPPLIKFYRSQSQNSLEEVIISLNEIVAMADTEFGCPFKAVSFHGNIQSGDQNMLHWEMVVDV